MYRRILTTLTLALVFGAGISVQAAMARPADVNPHALQSLVQTSQQFLSEKTPAMSGQSGLGAGARSVATPAEAAVAASDSGFNWSDAGIGAGVMFGTLLVGAGGVLAFRRYQHQHVQPAH
jgi:hypothetical protein